MRAHLLGLIKASRVVRLRGLFRLEAPLPKLLARRELLDRALLPQSLHGLALHPLGLLERSLGLVPRVGRAGRGQGLLLWLVPSYL